MQVTEANESQAVKKNDVSDAGCLLVLYGTCSDLSGSIPRHPILHLLSVGCHALPSIPCSFSSSSIKVSSSHQRTVLPVSSAEVPLGHVAKICDGGSPAAATTAAAASVMTSPAAAGAA